MKYYIDKSNIHGKGVFAKENIPKNTHLGILVKFKFYLPFKQGLLGKYLNHSHIENCRFQYLKNKNIYMLVSNKTINKNEELTINYNKTPWFVAGTWSI